MLYEQLDAIDINDPVHQREGRIAVLKKMVLSDKRLDRARQVCLEAHQALIAAERDQAQASQVLNSMQTGKTPAEKSTAEKASMKMQSIADALKKSEKNLKHAKDIFPKCEQEMRSLALRFPSLRSK